MMAQAFSQEATRIELLSANTLEDGGALGKNVRRLIGNVAFKHDNAYMYCDSAHLFADQNNLDAFGSIHIRQGDTLNLYGDMLKYDGNAKLAQLFNNVKLTDRTMLLTTTRMNYDMNTGVSSYTTGGKIVDKDNVLTSQAGYYYSRKKDFFYKKNVVLTNPKYVMKCDTLKYNTSSKISYFLPGVRCSGDTDAFCN